MSARDQARSPETLADDSHQGETSSSARPIRRSRTGCFTCRKRRKKCDEKRPECANCKRGNVQCEGFEKTQKWEVKNAANRARRQTIQRPNNVEIRPLIGNLSGLFENMPNLPLQSPSFAQNTTPPFYNQDYVIGQSSNMYDVGIAQLETPSNYDVRTFCTNSLNDGAVVFDNYQETQEDAQLWIGRIEENVPEFPGLTHRIVQEDFEFMPAELPYPINGLEDSKTHQRLFWHFTHEMSHLLTTSNGDFNPMNAEVILLAMRDRTVMKTILCLAGCHLLKKQHTVDHEIVQENERLHREVCNEQLRRAPLLQDNSRDLQEVIFATSLLLCLYEICEGTGNSTWKTHLDMARQALTMGPRSPESEPSDDGEPETIVTEINLFLLEYFIYHDSLATVTLPSPPSPKPRFQGSAQTSHHDPSMIGVNDGLCDFITHISAIRAQADASPRKPDGIVVQNALPIFRDLSEWKPKDMPRECRLIAKFYQWALWIWLYSIVYPREKGHAKVQDMVKRMVAGMNEIKSGDGVMSCLLFPIFIIGSAAIKVEDRAAISSQFKRLKDWSSLGNIDLAEGVVKKMWSDHDKKMPDSWDWVKQLESRNLSILVT